MENRPPANGIGKDQVATPALCLDLDALDANIRTMLETCRSHGLDWRPHAKCHKSPLIAKWLVQAGAIGVTCATIDEAEIMASAGVSDLLIANMLAGSSKITRLVELARHARPITCVDDLHQAQPISQAMRASHQTIRVLIELEIGMHRVGIDPGQAAVDLAMAIDRLPGLQLAGVMAYEGHLLKIADPAEKKTAIRAALAKAVDCKERIQQRGIPCPIVSCGGTGSYPITVQQPGITEIQAGGAIFMDSFYREACQIHQLVDALTVVATVVSRPTADRAVMDAGRKALNIEIHRPRVTSHDGVFVDRLSAEHGVLSLKPGTDLKIGERIELIPGYADLTNVLHRGFFGFRRGKLEQVIPIVSREPA